MNGQLVNGQSSFPGTKIFLSSVVDKVKFGGQEVSQINMSAHNETWVYQHTNNFVF